MAVDTKTKAIAGLALLDIARQAIRGWAAHERAERERMGFGQGIRRDVRRLAGEAREHAPDLSRWELERGWPPVHRRSRASAFAHSWGAVVAIVAISAAAVVAAARYVVRHEPDSDVEDVTTDSRVVGAIRSGSHAIDAGVHKVVEGGTTAAAGTAAAVAAGSSAVRTATVTRAREELDERVVAPARRKAVMYGSVGVLALTLYVVVIATVVSLIVGAIG